jgi:twitching motility protein PilT
MDLKKLLKMMVEKDASDLFLKPGIPPRLRINGKILPADEKALSHQEIKSAADELLSDAQKKMLEEKQEVDFGFDINGLNRYRASVLYQRSQLAMVIRRIRSDILSFEQLNLPVAILEKLSSESRGLVLLCGSTGSGKSTTIASMIEYINSRSPKHILTIEDPIEFVFEDRTSLITQREIGFDTPTYESALKHSMMQSPDVIFIGNIRDAETMSAALTAAETGQLVLSTIHSINSAETIERIVGFYQPHEREEIRSQLSLLLKGVISLRLIPKKDLTGRVPAYEVMLGTPTIKSLIREAKTHEIKKYIQDGASEGMITFDQCLAKLCGEKKISAEDAEVFADSPGELKLALSGIKKI